MSTLELVQCRVPSSPPSWTVGIPEDEYHAAAAGGVVVSSGTLRKFRLSPAEYRAFISGDRPDGDSGAFRFGRAVHKLLLEGEAAFASSFAIGGPVNERTGRSFGSGTRAFDAWLAESGLNPASVLTPAEAAAVRRVRDAALAHPEIARVFREGWAERSVRAAVEGVACQARLDWLRPDGVAVDVKTIDDIRHFEADAGRFGYLHQFAFYREVAREAGGGELAMTAVVLEKRPPFRAGVWRFSAAALEPYAARNRRDLKSLTRCRETNQWPTGYESPRDFPVAGGVPALWLN